MSAFDSSDDDIDDDFIPDSLRDFVKSADAALKEDLQGFMDELSPRNPELEVSNVEETGDIMQDLQANMDRIALIDKRDPPKVSIATDTSGYDSEDFASPCYGHNPSTNLTYTDLKRVALENTSTQNSELLYDEKEEKKTTHSFAGSKSPDIEIQSARSIQAKIEELGVEELGVEQNKNETTLTDAVGALEIQDETPAVATNDEEVSKQQPESVIYEAEVPVKPDVDKQEAEATNEEPPEATPPKGAMGFFSRMFTPGSQQQPQQSPPSLPPLVPSPEPRLEEYKEEAQPPNVESTETIPEEPKIAEATNDSKVEIYEPSKTEQADSPMGMGIDKPGNGNVDIYGAPEPTAGISQTSNTGKVDTDADVEMKPPAVSTGINQPGNGKVEIYSEAPMFVPENTDRGNGNVETETANGNEDRRSATARGISALAASFSGTGRIQPVDKKNAPATPSSAVPNAEDAMDIDPTSPMTTEINAPSVKLPAVEKKGFSHPKPSPAPALSFSASKISSPPRSIQVPTTAVRNITSSTTAKATMASVSPATRSRAAPTSRSRLMQPTAASRGHVSKIPTPGMGSTPSSGVARARVASTFSPSKSQMRSPSKPIARASPASTTYSHERRLYTTPTQARNRFMQPTASQIAHSSTKSTPQTSSSRKREGPNVPHGPSRLMNSTAASKARNSPPSSTRLPQKRTVTEDAVARARERVRQRKQQEARLFGTTGAEFSVGAKPKEKPKPVRERKTTTMGTTKTSPRFATPTSSAKAHQRKPATLSMAQSGNFFGKNLRSDTSPTAVASTKKHALTVPVAPKFSTTVRRKRAVEESDRRSSMTLAQSTTLLASSLRGSRGVPIPPVKRTTGLTVPQAPKFHTTHKRSQPKSATEVEQEKMNEFLNNPFRAKPKSGPGLHTGSSAGLSKVSKRSLTKPMPFKLSSSKKSSPPRPLSTSNVNAFRNTPEKNVKAFRNTPEKKRTVTSPQPFSFAVDMKSKTRGQGKRNSPGGFKARPLPKTTFRGPAIQVHQLSSPPSAKKQQQGRPYAYNGSPSPASAVSSPNQPNTPRAFKFGSA